MMNIALKNQFARGQRRLVRLIAVAVFSIGLLWAGGVWAISNSSTALSVSPTSGGPGTDVQVSVSYLLTTTCGSSGDSTQLRLTEVDVATSTTTVLENWDFVIPSVSQSGVLTYPAAGGHHFIVSGKRYSASFTPCATQTAAFGVLVDIDTAPPTMSALSVSPALSGSQSYSQTIALAMDASDPSGMSLVDPVFWQLVGVDIGHVASQSGAATLTPGQFDNWTISGITLPQKEKVNITVTAKDRYGNAASQTLGNIIFLPPPICVNGCGAPISAGASVELQGDCRDGSGGAHSCKLYATPDGSGDPKTSATKATLFTQVNPGVYTGTFSFSDAVIPSGQDSAAVDVQARLWSQNTYSDRWQQSFTVYRVPMASVGLSPAGSAAAPVVVNASADLQWPSVVGDGASSFQVEYAELGGVNQVTVSLGDTGSYGTPSLLDISKAYQWRVRGVNALGTTGPWSGYGYFAVRPSVPVLRGPADGAEVATINPVVVWTEAPGAEYDLKLEYFTCVANCAGSSTPPVIEETVSYRPWYQRWLGWLWPLVAQGRVYDEGDYTDDGVTRTYGWAEVGVYQTDGNCASGVCSFSFRQQSSPEPYRWSVRARSVFASSDYSAPRQFQVKPPPPPAGPQQLDPAHNGTVHSASPTLRWAREPSSASFTISLQQFTSSGRPVTQLLPGLPIARAQGNDWAEVGGFPQTVEASAICNGGVCEFPLSGLETGKGYRWVVRGTNPDTIPADGQWSSYWLFRVAQLPATPSVSVAAPQVIVGETAEYAWRSEQGRALNATVPADQYLPVQAQPGNAASGCVGQIAGGGCARYVNGDFSYQFTPVQNGDYRTLIQTSNVGGDLWTRDFGDPDDEPDHLVHHFEVLLDGVLVGAVENPATEGLRQIGGVDLGVLQGGQTYTVSFRWVNDAWGGPTGGWDSNAVVHQVALARQGGASWAADQGPLVYQRSGAELASASDNAPAGSDHGVACFTVQGDAFESCRTNGFTFALEAPLAGDYQLAIVSRNPTDLTSYGISHQLRVELDGSEFWRVGSLGSAADQTAAIPLGDLTAGNHTIRLLWENDWSDGAADSNWRLKEVRLELLPGSGGRLPLWVIGTGSQTVSIASANGFGSSSAAAVTVAGQAQPRISLVTYPQNVREENSTLVEQKFIQGGSAVLHWESTDASAVSITALPGSRAVLSVPAADLASGYQVDAPNGDITYLAMATGFGGRTITAQYALRVEPSLSNLAFPSLQADPVISQAGNEVLLRWSARSPMANAKIERVAADQSRTTVAAVDFTGAEQQASGSWGKLLGRLSGVRAATGPAVRLSGTVTVTPSENTSYVFSGQDADGTIGEAWATVVIVDEGNLDQLGQLVATGLAPDSFWYFLDVAGDWWQRNVFALTDEGKFIANLRQAQERVQELDRLVRVGKLKASYVQSIQARYQAALQRAAGLVNAQSDGKYTFSGDRQAALDRLREFALKQQRLLTDIEGRVPVSLRGNVQVREALAAIREFARVSVQGVFDQQFSANASCAAYQLNLTEFARAVDEQLANLTQIQQDALIAVQARQSKLAEANSALLALAGSDQQPGLLRTLQDALAIAKRLRDGDGSEAAAAVQQLNGKLEAVEAQQSTLETVRQVSLLPDGLAGQTALGWLAPAAAAPSALEDIDPEEIVRTVSYLRDLAKLAVSASDDIDAQIDTLKLQNNLLYKAQVTRSLESASRSLAAAKADLTLSAQRPAWQSAAAALQSAIALVARGQLSSASAVLTGVVLPDAALQQRLQSVTSVLAAFGSCTRSNAAVLSSASEQLRQLAVTAAGMLAAAQAADDRASALRQIDPASGKTQIQLIEETVSTLRQSQALLNRNLPVDQAKAVLRYGTTVRPAVRPPLRLDRQPVPLGLLPWGSATAQAAVGGSALDEVRDEVRRFGSRPSANGTSVTSRTVTKARTALDVDDAIAPVDPSQTAEATRKLQALRRQTRLTIVDDLEQAQDDTRQVLARLLAAVDQQPAYAIQARYLEAGSTLATLASQLRDSLGYNPLTRQIDHPEQFDIQAALGAITVFQSILQQLPQPSSSAVRRPAVVSRFWPVALAASSDSSALPPEEDRLLALRAGADELFTFVQQYQQSPYVALLAHLRQQRALLAGQPCLNQAELLAQLDGLLRQILDPAATTATLQSLNEQLSQVACSGTPSADADADGIPDDQDPDIDDDGVLNDRDNCRLYVNPDQLDSNGDGVGDACEGLPDANEPNPPLVDQDGDGIGDSQDNCPQTPNADQADDDADGRPGVQPPTAFTGPNARAVISQGGDQVTGYSGLQPDFWAGREVAIEGERHRIKRNTETALHIEGVWSLSSGTHVALIIGQDFGGDACDADSNNNGVADTVDPEAHLKVLKTVP